MVQPMQTPDECPPPARVALGPLSQCAGPGPAVLQGLGLSQDFPGLAQQLCSAWPGPAVSWALLSGIVPWVLMREVGVLWKEAAQNWALLPTLFSVTLQNGATPEVGGVARLRGGHGNVFCNHPAPGRIRAPLRFARFSK